MLSHEKKLPVLFCIVTAVLAGSAAYYLFFSRITEHRYNKIMCYYVARNVTAESGNFDAKITAIRDFVHENVLSIKGYDNVLATSAIEKLTSGVGWCDQQARVFMQLSRGIGITTRLLFLLSKDGSSPHSIAEALTPDGRWIIIDPAYRLDLRNKERELATRTDIKKDPGILADNKRVKMRARFERRWSDPEYLSIYSNPPECPTTKKGVKVDFLKFVPLKVINFATGIIARRQLDKIAPGIKNNFEFKIIKARTYHLLEQYERSENLYDEIIADSGDLPLVRKSQFYKAVLLKDRKMHDEACNYITGLITVGADNPYRKYLLGLRVRILKKMGKKKEAERDLMNIEYNLEA